MSPLLPRSALSRLSSAACNTRTVTCVACLCHCGRTFYPPPIDRSHNVRKYAQGAWRDQLRAKRSARKVEVPATLRGQESYEKQMDHILLAFEDIFYHFKDKGMTRAELGLRAELKDCYRFMIFVAWKCDRLAKDGTDRFIHPPELRRMMTECRVTETDADIIGRLLDGLSRKMEWKYTYTTAYFLSMSRAGNSFATLTLMSQWLDMRQTDPAAARLFEADLQHAKTHLREMSESDVSSQDNLTAIVLQGKVAKILGRSEQEAQLQAKAEKVKDDLDTAATPEWARGFDEVWDRAEQSPADRIRATDALQSGLEDDEPHVHYMYAKVNKDTDADGLHRPTALWLYHMTKAAMAFHPLAAHELAIFYSQTGWKYLADEPPDHVKPTPFDSYPGVNSKDSRFGKWIRDVSAFFGFQPPQSSQPPVKEMDLIYHHALYPDTALARFLVAWAWAEQAMTAGYLPTYLLAARMRLEKNFWCRADAPSSAINLHPDRYSYPSEADAYKDPARTIEEAKLDKLYSGKRDPPNRLYDASAAQILLTQVFIGYEAVKGSKGKKPDRASLRDMPKEYRKWFISDVVRQSYIAELDDIIASARAISDQHSWTIRDSKGALLYKPN